MDLELIGGVSAVFIIIAVLEIVKNILHIEKGYIPLLALALGLIASLSYHYFGSTLEYEAVITGIVLGLSAVGLYSTGKNVREGLQQK